MRQATSARLVHDQRPGLRGLSALFPEEEIGGPSKEDRDDGRSQSSRKKKRRIGQESEQEDDPYTPARPIVSHLGLSGGHSLMCQTPVDQSRTRAPSGRERRPVAQPGIVKLETPSPETAKPEPRSTRRRKKNVRDDGEESDDGKPSTFHLLVH